MITVLCYILHIQCKLNYLLHFLLKIYCNKAAKIILLKYVVWKVQYSKNCVHRIAHAVLTGDYKKINCDTKAYNYMYHCMSKLPIL